MRSILYQLTILEGYEYNCENIQSRIPTHPPFSALSLLLITATCTVRVQMSPEERLRYEKEKRLPHKDCGISKNQELVSSDENVDENVVENVVLGEFPWMALVGMQYNTTVDVVHTEYVCGGSLITDQYVITTANCISPINDGDNFTGLLPSNVTMIKVILGVISQNAKDINWEHRREYDVEKHLVHHKYVSAYLESNIALLKLDTRVSFNEYIRPICFAAEKDRSNMLSWAETVLAGWAMKDLKAPKDFQPALKKLKTEVLSSDHCKGTYLEKILLDDSVMCTYAHGEQSCGGNAGGPVMWRPRDRWTLVGMVSWGGTVRPCNPVFINIGVSTRISAYFHWIIDNLDI